VVDRFGPRPILFGGLVLLGVAAFGFAASRNYATLAFFSALAGTGNGVFHPVDYTLLNRKVHPARLGHAFSVHGITGSLGWALAPEAARLLHAVPAHYAAMCLTIYMVCSAGGMVAGGFLASDPARCERIVGAGFGMAATVALVIGFAALPAVAVPVLFGVMGF